MTPSQSQALLKLLQDGDPSTTRLVQDQLVQHGDDCIEDLKRFVDMDDLRVSRVARSVIKQVNLRDAQNEFDLLCRFFPEDGDLEQACWMLARALLPDADVDSCRRTLNGWGRKLLLKVSGAISCRERVKILASFLADELSFRGNSRDYYNVRNSLLPTVMEARCGLPIALSCLAIFLSHRAGMSVVGVNLPGHFVVRHGDVLFDPFHKGRILTKADCAEILRCQGIEPHASCLCTATPRRVLQRVLSNLVYAYDRCRENENAALARRWLCALRRGA